MKTHFRDIMLQVITDRTTLANVGTLAVINWGAVDMMLKIVLTVATIVWTGFRIWNEVKKLRNGNGEKTPE